MSFDRVAHIYDATRAIPEDVIDKVVHRVATVTNAGPDSRFLEMGIGTGRIALPFIQAGYTYSGVDISDEMMAQLRTKAGEKACNLTLTHADVTDLPFPDHCMDVIVTVHLLHLVPDWRVALREARRVLHPDGYFVMGRDSPVTDDPGEEIRRQWHTLVAAAGVALRPSYGSWDAVHEELTNLGGRIGTFRVASWSREFRPKDLLDEQRNRIFSLSWDVPDVVLEEVNQQMEVWATDRYGTMEAPLESHEEFLLSVTRFDRQAVAAPAT